MDTSCPVCRIVPPDQRLAEDDDGELSLYSVGVAAPGEQRPATRLAPVVVRPSGTRAVLAREAYLQPAAAFHQVETTGPTSTLVLQDRAWGATSMVISRATPEQGTPPPLPAPQLRADLRQTRLELLSL